jgi:tetratricopeptide (TPR) repeat protein
MDINELLKYCQLVGITKPKKKAKPSQDVIAIARSELISGKTHGPFNSRIVQNFVLIWLHPPIDDMNDNDFCNSIAELRRVVNSITKFSDVDQCIDFLTDIKEEKVLMIIPDQLGQNMVSVVHDIPQINSIYVFCKNGSQNKQWAQQWPKVKDIFTTIAPICQAVKQDAQKCDQDSISISFVSLNSERSDQNLDQLDSTFMYTQILKEILLTIKFNRQHITDFATYYRKNFDDNAVQLNNIDRFEREYDNNRPIWWYTHESCFYSILNRALRMMEVDTIIKMGFFIHDLHHKIAELHAEQFNEHRQLERFTIYRGQGLSKTDFDKMEEIQGGLISFNNFLSTSKDPTVAHGFAHSSLVNPASVGVVFVILIDPSIKSTPFASIDGESCYNTEEEILFSMHTVFRIDGIMKISNDNRLWQVDLVQTSDNDPQLHDLTKWIRDEIRGKTEWDKLAKLLMKLNEYAEVDVLYEALLDKSNNARSKIHIYHQLGWSKKKQKKYKEALTFYQKALDIKQIIFPSDHASFIPSCNEIGFVYEKMNEHSKALLYYERGLQYQLETPSSDGSTLACSYSKIGSVYERMDEYEKALSFHEKAVEILQRLPSKKEELAFTYSNIGDVYKNMDEYTKAISSYQKALEIREKILPSNHPDIAQSYSSIGFVYGKIHQYSKARQFHQQAVDIGQRSLTGNHPRLQQWRKNLEYVKKICN